MTWLGNTILLICGMAIAMQAVTGLRCLKESGSSVACNSSPRECHIAVGNSSILPILGCGQTPFSGNGLGCRRANSATIYCACNTDNCNTFASTKKFLRDERQGFGTESPFYDYYG